MTNHEAERICSERLNALGWSLIGTSRFLSSSNEQKVEVLKCEIQGIESEQGIEIDDQVIGAMQYEIDQLTIALNFWAPAENIELALEVESCGI